MEDHHCPGCRGISVYYTKGDFEQPQGGLTRVIDCNQYWGGGGSDVEDGSTDSSTKNEPKLKDDRLGF